MLWMGMPGRISSIYTHIEWRKCNTHNCILPHSHRLASANLCIHPSIHPFLFVLWSEFTFVLSVKFCVETKSNANNFYLKYDRKWWIELLKDSTQWSNTKHIYLKIICSITNMERQQHRHYYTMIIIIHSNHNIVNQLSHIFF